MNEQDDGAVVVATEHNTDASFPFGVEDDETEEEEDVVSFAAGDEDDSMLDDGDGDEETVMQKQEEDDSTVVLDATFIADDSAWRLAHHHPKERELSTESSSSDQDLSWLGTEPLQYKKNLGAAFAQVEAEVSLESEVHVTTIVDEISHEHLNNKDSSSSSNGLNKLPSSKQLLSDPTPSKASVAVKIARFEGTAAAVDAVVENSVTSTTTTTTSTSSTTTTCSSMQVYLRTAHRPTAAIPTHS